MRLFWTKKARTRLAEILHYIEEEFGEAARQQFRSRTHEFTNLLKEFPEMGSLEIRDKKIRGFQITKQTRVFYRLKNDKITILTFFGSRQDPKK
ncbi:MAG TPA: type II toxin-antitoxin system RelE/ParE family toxin [Cyclobacteriaceae bacterium]|jgi:plasmid stabilization system protein ParE